MGMNLPGPSQEPEVMLDINTTPLIDVMLVLLIMLIITIPVQLHAIHLDVGADAATPRTPPTVVRVDIDARGQVRWNGQPVNAPQDLQTLLHGAASQQPQPELHIRADGQAPYQAVAAVMAGAQREGVTKMGVVGLSAFANADSR